MSLQHPPQRLDLGHAFIDQKAVADLLGVSTRTLERWRLEGCGPAFRKFGRRVMYSQTDVLIWANDRRRTSTSEYME